MATNGGNLLQRTRCQYFYDTAMPCNKREPGTGCGAREGLNRIHAILGWSEKCVATYPGDMANALYALDAVVRVRGAGGRERTIPIDEFHRLPGDTPERDTNLEHGELIVAIELPKSNFAKNSYYLKVRDRASYAFALVAVAAALELDGGTIRQARVVLGGVAHKPWRSRGGGSRARRQARVRGELPAGCRGGTQRCEAARAQRLQGRAGEAGNRSRADAREQTGAEPGGIVMPRYIGKEMSRVDGVAKVTGKAKYAAEFQVPNLAYGFIVLGSIATKGTIKAIDTREAEARRGRDPRLHAPEHAEARAEGFHRGGAAAGRRKSRTSRSARSSPTGSSSTRSPWRSSSPRRTSRRGTRRASSRSPTTRRST